MSIHKSYLTIIISCQHHTTTTTTTRMNITTSGVQGNELDNNHNHSFKSPQKSSQHKLNQVASNKINKMTNYSTPSIRLVASLSLFVLLVSVITIECHIKRTQYHEQGVHGPKSYKFGYTSGDHKNPQERHETSDAHGHVKGWYSFIDGSGKHQVIHYEAHPKYGFKVYNHKSKAYNSGKRHYGS